jgi:hypothetical protein
MVGAYTLGGVLSSSAVGAAVASLGRLVAPSPRVALWAVVAVGAATATRELGWLRLPLPQLRRQTSSKWSKALGQPLASFLWGLDIGFLFTTWLTFAGAWLVAAIAFVVGSPALGAAAVVAYWLGRVLTVWLAPFWISGPGKTMELMLEVSGERALFRRLHASAISLITVVFVVTHSISFMT